MLECLAATGLCLNKDKCSFLQTLIEYLGHVIDAQGLHPTYTEEKISAINYTTFFLGHVELLQQVHVRIVTEVGTLVYVAICKESRWIWESQQERAFAEAKNMLEADSVLVHFDPAMPLILACDASDYGLGAVLSHQDDNGERPIVYISHTLNPAEKKYSQLEKEALAIVFAVKKFHQYLYGVHFTIQSDHQPLSFLFNEHKSWHPPESRGGLCHWQHIVTTYSTSPGKS